MDIEKDSSVYYKYSEKSILNKNHELYKKIMNWLPHLEIDFKERFYLMENGLSIIPSCYCGNPTKFINMTNGFRDFCSKRCMYDSQEIKDKRAESSLKKWGVINPSKSELIKKKVKKTNNEKFGVDYPLQSKSIKDAVRDGFIEKFGVDNPSKLPQFREKAYQTNLEKFGVVHAMQSDTIKNRVKDKFIEKFGVDNPSKLTQVREKAYQTNLEKFGVRHAMQSKSIRDRVKNTLLKKWGFDNYSKTPEYRKSVDLILFVKNSDIVNDQFNTLIQTTSTSYLINCKKCGNEFNIQRQLFRNRRNSGEETCLICNPVTYSSSLAEGKIYEYISTIYGGEIRRNFKIGGREIDIYLPDFSVGFEYNGLYWHSELNKEKDYHLVKKELISDMGIKLIQIWEDDWSYKQDIVKSMIGNNLSLSDRIWARECQLIEISDNKMVKKFLDENHIQGYVCSKVKLGLFHNGELVSLMTFGHLRKALGRNSQIGIFELLRFCNKRGFTVVGGASKLFNYFINNFEYNEVISYSLNSYSDGKLYEKLGFIEAGEPIPNYFWAKNGMRYNRFNFRKDKLVRMGNDPDKTESEIMYSLGYYRVYDAGSKRWLFENQMLKS